MHLGLQQCTYRLALNGAQASDGSVGTKIVENLFKMVRKH